MSNYIAELVASVDFKIKDDALKDLINIFQDIQKMLSNVANDVKKSFDFSQVKEQVKEIKRDLSGLKINNNLDNKKTRQKKEKGFGDILTKGSSDFLRLIDRIQRFDKTTTKPGIQGQVTVKAQGGELAEFSVALQRTASVALNSAMLIQQVSRTLKSNFSLIVASINYLKKGFGVVSNIITAITKGQIKSYLAQFTAFLATHWVILSVVAVILSLVTAFLIFSKKGKEIRNKISKWWDNFKSGKGLSGFSLKIRNLLVSLYNIIVMTINTILAFCSWVWDGLKNLGSKIVNIFIELIQNIQKKLSSLPWIGKYFSGEDKTKAGGNKLDLDNRLLTDEEKRKGLTFKDLTNQEQLRRMAEDKKNNSDVWRNLKETTTIQGQSKVSNINDNKQITITNNISSNNPNAVANAVNNTLQGQLNSTGQILSTI